MSNPTLFIAFALFVLAVAIAVWQFRRKANRKAAEREAKHALYAGEAMLDSFVPPRYRGHVPPQPIPSPASAPVSTVQDDFLATSAIALALTAGSRGESEPTVAGPAFASGGGGEFDGAGATGRWEPAPAVGEAPTDFVAATQIGSCTIEPAPSPAYSAPAESPAPSYSAPSPSPAPSDSYSCNSSSESSPAPSPSPSE